MLFRPEINMNNVYGCYLSPSVRRQPSGWWIFKAYTSKKDDYATMYEGLYNRLIRYKSMSPRCTLDIRVYEGEISQRIGIKDKPTDSVLRKYPLRDEEEYK